MNSFRLLYLKCILLRPFYKSNGEYCSVILQILFNKYIKETNEVRSNDIIDSYNNVWLSIIKKLHISKSKDFGDGSFLSYVQYRKDFLNELING